MHRSENNRGLFYSNNHTEAAIKALGQPGQKKMKIINFLRKLAKDLIHGQDNLKHNLANVNLYKTLVTFYSLTLEQE